MPNNAAAAELQKHHDRLAAVLRHAEAQSKQHRNEQNRHDVALDEGFDKGRRDDREQKIRQTNALGTIGVSCDGFRIKRRRIGIETSSDLPDIADHHSDDQRQGRGHLEIDQRLGADIGDVANVAHLGNPERDRGEDNRTHHDLDRLHKGIAERFEIYGEVRNGVAHAQRRERPRRAPAHKACDKTARAPKRFCRSQDEARPSRRTDGRFRTRSSIFLREPGRGRLRLVQPRRLPLAFLIPVRSIPRPRD